MAKLIFSGGSSRDVRGLAKSFSASFHPHNRSCLGPLSPNPSKAFSIRRNKGKPMLRPGGAAPPFRLPATGSREVSLSEFRGRTVVLYFYPKDNTSGCTREAQDFNGLRDAFAACDTEVIGVSADGLASHDKFRTKYGLDLTLASDEAKGALDAYQPVDEVLVQSERRS